MVKASVSRAESVRARAATVVADEAMRRAELFGHANDDAVLIMRKAAGLSRDRFITLQEARWSILGRTDANPHDLVSVVALGLLSMASALPLDAVLHSESAAPTAGSSPSDGARPCQRCGEAFETKGRWAKFCPPCRPEVKRETSRTYYLQRQGRIRAAAPQPGVGRGAA